MIQQTNETEETKMETSPIPPIDGDGLRFMNLISEDDMSYDSDSVLEADGGKNELLPVGHDGHQQLSKKRNNDDSIIMKNSKSYTRMSSLDTTYTSNNILGIRNSKTISYSDDTSQQKSSDEEHGMRKSIDHDTKRRSSTKSNANSDGSHRSSILTKSSTAKSYIANATKSMGVWSR